MWVSARGRVALLVDGMNELNIDSKPIKNDRSIKIDLGRENIGHVMLPEGKADGTGMTSSAVSALGILQ